MGHRAGARRRLGRALEAREGAGVAAAAPSWAGGRRGQCGCAWGRTCGNARSAAPPQAACIGAFSTQLLDRLPKQWAAGGGGGGGGGGLGDKDSRLGLLLHCLALSGALHGLAPEVQRCGGGGGAQVLRPRSGAQGRGLRVCLGWGEVARE
jgi:hypothetical protein